MVRTSCARGTSISWLASAAAAVITGASAQDVPPRPDTSTWKCERCPFARGYEAEYELGATYVSEDAARFGNATGYDEQGGYVLASGTGQYDTDAYRMQWDLLDLGLDSRVVEISGGAPGTYEYQLEYSELPYRRYDTTDTVFRQAGDDALVLPDDWVRAGTTSGFTALDASLIDRNIGSDRQSLQLGGEFSGIERLRLRADYRRTERDGHSIVGASFFNSAALLPARFDERTDVVDFGAAYSLDRGFIELSWTGSFYDNTERAWRWDNPYLGPAQGQIAQAPDSDAQTITLAGAYRFAANTVLSLSAATGEIEQDESLLAYSIDPSLAAALPRSSLDGKVDTTHVDLRLTSRPSQFLRLRGVYRYDERDNRTPVAQWSRVITDLFASGEPEDNRPYSFERSRLELSAAARVDWWSWLEAFEFEGGYERVETDRTLQEVAEQTEDGGWGRVRWRALDAEVSLRAGASRRDTDHYDTGVAAALEQNPLLRKYTLAYRFRDFFELRATLGWPGRPITFGGEAFYASDDYSESPLGLRKSDDRRYAADVTWAVSERVSVYLQGGYEDLESRSVGSESFDGADWQAQHRDRFRTLGAGLDFGTAADRFGTRVALTYAQGLGDLDVTSALSGGGAYPRLETELKSAVVDFDYQVSAALDLRLQLRYEDFSSADWAHAGVKPATIPTVLTLGADPYDYDVYLVSLSMRYRFGRPAATARSETQSRSAGDAGGDR
jgi:MtrB/PioB family decaheme-associated outer membrane protein